MYSINSFKITSKAFSLIELMVVIAIVALLAVVALPAYQQYVSKAKLSGAMSFFATQANAVKMYYTEHGVFPTTVAQIGLPTGPSPNQTLYSNDPDDFLAPYVGNISFQPANLGTCDAVMLVMTATNYNGGVYDGNNGDFYQFSHYIVEGNDGIIYDMCISFGAHYDNGFQNYTNYNFSGCPDGTGDNYPAAQAILDELEANCI